MGLEFDCRSCSFNTLNVSSGGNRVTQEECEASKDDIEVNYVRTVPCGLVGAGIVNLNRELIPEPEEGKAFLNDFLGTVATRGLNNA